MSINVTNIIKIILFQLCEGVFWEKCGGELGAGSDIS